MKPIQSKEEYQEYVNAKSPNSPILKNCFNAFNTLFFFVINFAQIFTPK